MNTIAVPLSNFRKLVESSITFVVSVIVLLASGLTITWLSQSDASAIGSTYQTFYTLLQAVYYIGALRLLTQLTSPLVGKIRPAVNIDDEDFAEYARRISGSRTHYLFTVLAPFLACIWLIAALIWLFNQASTSMEMLHTMLVMPLPWIAIIFSCVSLLRMWRLMQLAQQPLHMSLFDVSTVLPFGQLSSLYSLLIISGEMLHLFLLGVPNIEAFMITSFSTITSIIALLLPMWAVHRQMVALKEKTLKTINSRIDTKLHTFLHTDEDKPAAGSDTIPALHTLRTIVLTAPTWPISNVISTVRAFVVPFLPIIYVLAQNLILPYFTAFLKTMGFLTE